MQEKSFFTVFPGEKQEPAAGCGPLVNPFVAIDYGLNDEPPISGVLCALGATTENALRTVFGTVELPIDTLIGALAGWNVTYICSQTDVSSPTNIATHFTNNFNEFLLSVASIIPNLFQYIDAPVVSDCITGTSDGGNGGGTATLVQLLYDSMRLVLFIVYYVLIGLTAILEAIAGELGSNFCELVIVPSYDDGLGRLVDVIFDFIELIVCIVTVVTGSTDGAGSAFCDFECFMLVMINIFGSSDRIPATSSRYITCTTTNDELLE